jgi:hypothetical protein
MEEREYRPDPNQAHWSRELSRGTKRYDFMALSAALFAMAALLASSM